MAMASTNNDIDLPREIIMFEILLRLPVKSLLKFKCACKSWNALIENPNFVRLHYGHEHNREHLLVWHRSPGLGCNRAVSLDVTLCKYEETDHLRIPLAVCGLRGHVNGIYCVFRPVGRMALWNPARKQFRPIPSNSIDIQLPLNVFREVVGFGMDSSSGDYKVVSIRCIWNEEERDQYYPSAVSVYSSRSNSWRRVDDELVDSVHSSDRTWIRFPHEVDYLVHSSYLNGIVYFLSKSHGSYTNTVLAFDTSSETFQEIKVPDCIKYVAQIFAYGNSIALISIDSYYKFSGWAMEKGCWNMKFVAGPFVECASFGLWDNNKLLLRKGDLDLNMLNVNTGELTRVESLKKESDTDTSVMYSVSSYKESLFSLEGGGAHMWTI